MRDLLSIQRRMKEKFATFPRRRLPMLNRTVLTSVVVALATTITTQSFAQDRGTGATPAAGAKAGATQGTFTTSHSVEARRSQAPWTADVRGVGESKPGRLGDPAKVSCG